MNKNDNKTTTTIPTYKVGVDATFLHGIIDGDKQFEKELLNIFCENAHRNMVRMQECINNNDNNGWYMATHAFKGASASIGAFDLAKALEKAQKRQDATAEEKKAMLQE